MTKKNANAWMKPTRALLPALLMAALLWALPQEALAYPVDPPTISRAGGRYLGSQTVVITCRPGWYISYTTDGSEPIQMWLSDDAYVQPANPTGSRSVTLVISQSCVLRAAAYRPETDTTCEYSGEAAQSYVIYEENHAPTFSPEGGNVDRPVAHITISCEEGWQIAYAIEDGSVAGTAELITYEYGMYRPAVSSIYYPIFHAGSSVTISLPTDPARSVKAIAYQETADGQYRFSPIVQQVYCFKLPEYQMAAPKYPVITVNSIIPVEGYTQTGGLRVDVYIEAKAFQGDALIYAVDAGHCAVIGAEAFKNCVNLSRIRLSYFCQIAPSAFDGCGTVYVFAPSGGQTEAACAAIGNCVFVAE